jgi:hypothetical protein
VASLTGWDVIFSNAQGEHLTETAAHSSPRDVLRLYRLLLLEIKESAIEKFPSEPGLERHVVCSFFFLRFLCPALVAPGKYHVPIKLSSKSVPVLFAEEMPLYSVRSLILVSKVLQAIGNGTGLDTAKESWMQVLTPFVESQFETVGSLFDILLSRWGIASFHLHSPEFMSAMRCSPSASGHEPQVALSVEAEEYIRTRVDDWKALGGYLYDTMRVLPPISKSHPITWTRQELHIWLRASGLEKFIPAFHRNGLYGEFSLLLGRGKVSDCALGRY